jgi:hypothetical protein
MNDMRKLLESVRRIEEDNIFEGEQKRLRTETGTATLMPDGTMVVNNSGYKQRLTVEQVRAAWSGAERLPLDPETLAELRDEGFSEEDIEDSQATYDDDYGWYDFGEELHVIPDAEDFGLRESAEEYTPELEDDAEIIADFVVKLQRRGLEPAQIVSIVKIKFGPNAAKEVSDDFEDAGDLEDWNNASFTEDVVQGPWKAKEELSENDIQIIDYLIDVIDSSGNLISASSAIANSLKGDVDAAKKIEATVDRFVNAKPDHSYAKKLTNTMRALRHALDYSDFGDWNESLDEARSGFTRYKNEVLKALNLKGTFTDAVAGGYRVKLWVPRSQAAKKRDMAEIRQKLDDLGYTDVRVEMRGFSDWGVKAWLCLIVPMSYDNPVNEAWGGGPVNVPKFDTEEEAERFVSSLGPDDTVENDVVNPETGEVLFEPGQTKRTMYSGQYKDEQGRRDAIEPWVPTISAGRTIEDAYDCLISLRHGDFYHVVWKNIADLVDEPDRWMDKDYDVDYEVPYLIKRKDGEKLTLDDRDNFKELERAVLRASTMQNVGIQYMGASNEGTVARFMPTFN